MCACCGSCTGGAECSCLPREVELPKTLRVALAGNPNVGKSTLFNNLTGARQHVANYPGVTVERRTGEFRRGKTECRLIDLPGIYSLAAFSTEEVIARRVLLDEQPDVVVNILDASNLERNLYLTVQLLELGVPLVVALNMCDLAAERGMKIWKDRLEAALGCPVVEVVGTRGEGMPELVEAVFQVAMRPRPLEGRFSHLTGSIRDLVLSLEEYLDTLPVSLAAAPRWTALKLVEKAQAIIEMVGEVRCSDVWKNPSVRQALDRLGESPELAVANMRYAYISRICADAIRSSLQPRRAFSDRVDSVLTHRLLALPLFLLMMYLVFQFTFTLATPFMDWIDAGFSALGGWVASLWPEGSESAIRDLLVDGVISGVGGVLVFLPNILLLFLAIGILEDSGYMARAAFIMDRIMRRFGLHGKSFIPMLVGFGCTIPAVMATRTIENPRQRLLTMLVLPLMSCGARLPIYTLIIPAFFPERWHGVTLFGIYMLGLILALGIAVLLRKTLFQGRAEALIMELPPYRVPTLKAMVLRIGERAWVYLRRAGTIILAVSIGLWVISNYPKPPEPSSSETPVAQVADGEEETVAQASALEYSLAGRLGKFAEPVLEPMGFDWKIGVALVGAFAAKEVFVAQLGVVHAVGESEDEENLPLREKLRTLYTPLTGFCIMIFSLIAMPCMATVAVVRRESNSWRWAIVQMVGLTALGWVITTAVYQIGQALGWGV